MVGKAVGSSDLQSGVFLWGRFSLREQLISPPSSASSAKSENVLKFTSDLHIHMYLCNMMLGHEDNSFKCKKWTSICMLISQN